MNQDREAGYIRIEHVTSDGEIDEFEHGVRVPLDGHSLSDEDSSREADESEYLPSMALGDLSDRDGFMANPASDVDSPRSTHMRVSRGHATGHWQMETVATPRRVSEQRRHGASTEGLS